MSAAYLSHFDLREPPFSKEISDADLWLPTSKQLSSTSSSRPSMNGHP